MLAATTVTSGSVAPTSTSSENIRVCARFRPLNKSEEASKMCVTFRDNESLELNTDSDTYPFTFSKVYVPSATQEEIYKSVGEPVVRDVLQGYNGTIFVYGQTGSGKTYTMMGSELHHHSTPQTTALNASVSTISGFGHNGGGGGAGYYTARASSAAPQFHFEGPLAGIIPRAVFDLFDRIQRADAELVFDIKLFFVEIYMEHVRDLLEPSRTNLNVREEPASNSFYVDGCECPYISSAEEVLMYVEQGLRNRTTAATRMNDVSSRSHCLLGLTVKSTHAHRGETKVGKLYLVDLAGTEKVAKTRAEGVQLEEAKLINKSLTTLGLVIKNLTESKAQHIPYRDSKLTKILQDALGGNSRTSLIVCCSPSFSHWQESHSTLRFGARAKRIQNRAVVNKEYTVTELKNMLLLAQAEINRLKTGGAVPGGAPGAATTTNAVESSITALELEVRLREIEDLYHSQLASKDELIKQSQLEALSATQQASQQATLVHQLQEEIAAWQAEYQELNNELSTQSRRLDRERAGRGIDRALLEKLLESTLKARNDVQWIRAACCEAVRELQTEVGGIGGSGAASSTAAALALVSDESAEAGLVGPASTSGRSQMVGPVLSGASSSLDAAASSPTVAALTQRLHLLDKQYGDLELSWRELMNENGTLMLELQLADKKLAIRHDRIENLKSGLRAERQMSKELQDDLEEERKTAKTKLLDARGDAEYWRCRFEAMQASFLQHRGGKDGTAGGGPGGLAAPSSAALMTPQHSRVIKHIRGGVKSSPPAPAAMDHTAFAEQS